MTPTVVFALSLNDISIEGWSRGDVAVAFAAVWAGVVLVWLALDWLGNPNSGRFRPEGPRVGRGVKGRLEARRLARDLEDAEIREALRTAHGRSSLRLRWSKLAEATTAAHDEARLPSVPRLIEIGADPTDGLVSLPVYGAQPVESSEAEDDYGRDDEQAESHQPTEADDTEVSDTEVSDTEADGSMSPGRWSIGLDPRKPTRAGATPSRKTIRTRMWRNRAATAPADGDAELFGDDNLERMKRGRAPQRWNPVLDRTESAQIVSYDELTIGWGHRPVDPFAPTDLVEEGPDER